MSNSIKHVSSDLQLALRAQAVDDFDPELLYPGVEEEEEEEEEDPDDEDHDPDDEGDGDRGDDVDPGLSDEDDEPAATKDNEPAVDEDLDLDALAELADGSKEQRIPRSRFNEVNENFKTERAARLRLEEEVARLRGGAQPEATAAKPAAPEAYNFDDAEDRYMEALMEGDKKAALEIRNEIRSEERKQFTAESAQSAHKAADAELKRRDAETEQSAAQRVLSEAVTKYPFLDHEGDEADADAIEDVIARRDLYLKQGMTFSKALATAVEKVAPRYAPQVKAPASKDKPTATTEQINRNLEREKRIPAAMPGVGERGKDIDWAALSEDEFDALSDKDKRAARGDFVKEEA